MKFLMFILISIFRIDSWIYWLNRRKVTIISYHNPSYDVLELHLKYLETRYNFITIDELYTCFYSRTKGRKLPKHALILTFDDGYKQNVELLPLLIQYKVIPVIYCCSDVIASRHVYWDKVLGNRNPGFYKAISNKERLILLDQEGLYQPQMESDTEQGLSDSDIKMLKPYVIWGSHTKTHVILTQCTREEKIEEIEESKVQMETIVGKCFDSHFAYPSGCYDDECIDILKCAGFKTARTTDVGWNDMHTDPYKLKVIGISDNADLLKFRFQLSGLSMWLQYLRHGSLWGRNNNFITKK